MKCRKVKERISAAVCRSAIRSVRIHFLLKDPCAGATPCGPNSGGGHVKLKLSSGPYWTMHADFWNTWRQRRLNELTTTCLRHHKDCGILGVETTDV